MPVRSPFTRLCQMTAQAAGSLKADLHVHSTASDGQFSPQEVVARARLARLTAIAITDHDTLSGYEAVKDSVGIEIIAGVEITSEFEGRELHLLGYFVDPRHPGLSAALDVIRAQRRERFEAMAGRLHGCGASLDNEALRLLLDGDCTLGRRHLARLLVEGKQAGNYYEAFARYLNKPEIAELPKARLPVRRAIELVRAAGGAASWAHPPSDATMEQMRDLRSLGLSAVECEYPWSKASHGRKLRAMAEELGLGISGGSDCHGPQPSHRAIGAKGINRAELESIRLLAV
jgi:3',5'-nucleoside bisphosphate phosphatase